MYNIDKIKYGSLKMEGKMRKVAIWVLAIIAFIYLSILSIDMLKVASGNITHSFHKKTMAIE